MSRAEGAERLLEAAAALGVQGGVSALTVQGIADAAGVSKALVLYHFGDKRAVFTALARALADADARALDAASTQADPIDAWRRLGSDAALSGRRALLAALLQEAPVRARARALRATREASATALAAAILERAGLHPSLAVEIVGAILLQQLDGRALVRPLARPAVTRTVAARTAGATAEPGANAAFDASRGESPDESPEDATLDAFVLALLSLGE